MKYFLILSFYIFIKKNNRHLIRNNNQDPYYNNIPNNGLIKYNQNGLVLDNNLINNNNSNNIKNKSNNNNNNQNINKKETDEEKKLRLDQVYYSETMYGMEAGRLNWHRFPKVMMFMHAVSSIMTNLFNVTPKKLFSKDFLTTLKNGLFLTAKISYIISYFEQNEKELEMDIISIRNSIYTIQTTPEDLLYFYGMSSRYHKAFNKIHYHSYYDYRKYENQIEQESESFDEAVREIIIGIENVYRIIKSTKTNIAELKKLNFKNILKSFPVIMNLLGLFLAIKDPFTENVKRVNDNYNNLKNIRIRISSIIQRILIESSYTKLLTYLNILVVAWILFK